jgi:hypothetical protein
VAVASTASAVDAPSSQRGGAQRRRPPARRTASSRPAKPRALDSARDCTSQTSSSWVRSVHSDRQRVSTSSSPSAGAPASCPLTCVHRSRTRAAAASSALFASAWAARVRAPAALLPAPQRRAARAVEVDLRQGRGVVALEPRQSGGRGALAVVQAGARRCKLEQAGPIDGQIGAQARHVLGGARRDRVALVQLVALAEQAAHRAAGAVQGALGALGALLVRRQALLEVGGQVVEGCQAVERAPRLLQALPLRPQTDQQRPARPLVQHLVAFAFEIAARRRRGERRRDALALRCFRVQRAPIRRSSWRSRAVSSAMRPSLPSSASSTAARARNAAITRRGRARARAAARPALSSASASPAAPRRSCASMINAWGGVAPAPFDALGAAAPTDPAARSSGGAPWHRCCAPAAR